MNQKKTLALKLGAAALLLVPIGAVSTISPSAAGEEKVKEERVKVGDKAPDFSLPSQDGSQVSLNDFKDKKTVVLYFYPKDKTPICTKEACLFRDDFSVFTDAGAVVLGVSSDSVESHKAFAEEQRLPFKLLSDKDSKIRKLYGVPSVMGLKPGRVTYVIDPQGTVRLVFESQLHAKEHVSEALEMLKTINSTKS